MCKSYKLVQHFVVRGPSRITPTLTLIRDAPDLQGGVRMGSEHLQTDVKPLNRSSSQPLNTNNI